MATIIGLAGAETHNGTTEDDTFLGNLSEDTVFGGEGVDTVVVNYTQSQVEVSFAPAPFVDVTTPDGVIRLDSVEVLRFDDATVTVDSLAPYSSGVQVFSGDFFRNSTIDMSTGESFLYFGPASQGATNNNRLYFEPVAGGRAYYQGQNLNNDTGTVNSINVDPSGGNTPQLGVQGFSQSLATMKDANWLFFELYIFNGDDRITGSYQNDNLIGFDGDDTIFGGLGDKEGYDVENPPQSPLPSTIRTPGDTADPAFFKDDGNDILEGRDGDDRLDGGTGNDTLRGGADNDELWGGGGAYEDILDGGSGNDTLHGGDGIDTALFTVASTEITGQVFADRVVLNSADGEDVVYNDVENFGFSDGTLTYSDVVRILNNVPPTGTISISGTPAEDEELTAVSTLNDGNGLGTLSYQWLRDGNVIDGATSETYTLTQEDVGAKISVRVSYTDDAGTDEEVTSDETTEVANVNDAPTGDVSITGTPVEDGTLSAVATLADEDGLGTLSYQWLRDGNVIDGATSETYTLTQEDVGAKMSVRVSYTDDQGTEEEVTSDETTEVANVNDAPTGGVSVTGTPEQGSTLMAVSTLADEDGVGTLSYQWLRDGNVIDGATSASYTLAPADVGAAMSVRVSYTDDSGTDEQKTSTETAAVTSSEPPCDEEGTDGPDVFVGTIFCTKFDGLGGNDSITGGPGDDGLKGGDGDDTINGGAGNDRLPGGNGNDVINGGPGNDRIGGGFGNDSMVGGEGNDGGGAGPGNDTIEAGDGNDRFNAGFGQDYIDMGAGDDVSGASFGNDTMFGGDGNDFLTGGDGNDEIHGDAGEDTINSGLGDDTVTGGADADQFVFNALFGGGTTVITDFEDGIDTIRVVGLRNPPDPVGRLDIENTTINEGEFAGQTGVAMSYGDHTIIVLDTAEKDFSPSDFTVDDFLFV